MAAADFLSYYLTGSLPYDRCHMEEEGRSVLFNDALNTFYLRLYSVLHRTLLKMFGLNP